MCRKPRVLTSGLEYRERLIELVSLSERNEIQREIAREREKTLLTFRFDAEVVLV